MKVLLVSMKYDYGDKSRGSSLERYYFEEPLQHIVATVLTFDYMTVLQNKGKERMNQALLDMVCHEKPDVTIIVPYTDQLIPQVLNDIKKQSITLGYYFDDTWRIKYSGFWAKHFNYVTTSDVNGVNRWRDSGYNNFVYSPFGCNHRLFMKKNLAKLYDVSFVGGYHPHRAWCLRRLSNSGINAQAWGYGWPNGRLSFEGMVDVFNQSRINLNLSNNESWDLRYVLSPTKPMKDCFRVMRNAFRAATLPDAKTREMVKARHFEINACGGFQLSYYAEGLEGHFQIGEEIALYESVDGMVDKVHYYLKHADEREANSQRGYARTLRDHTMEKRFADLFDRILPSWRINEKG
jgi:spore maturation protein CgeB